MMELYYVEIRSTLNGVLLHAELIMTHSRKNAENTAWERLLEDASEGNRALLIDGLIETTTTSRLITDVNALGKGEKPYYTHEILKYKGVQHEEDSNS